MYMKLREDQEKVRTLLCDTVTLLCKNGLTFSKELRVEGLLGITLDQTEVFIVHINEKLFNDDMNGVVKDTAAKVQGQQEISPFHKTRKRGHLENDMEDESSPAKRPNSNGYSNHSMSDLYDTYNNNVSETVVKAEKDQDTSGFLEDDRNAMRFCYNLDDEEAGREDEIVEDPVRRGSRGSRSAFSNGVNKRASQSPGSGSNCDDEAVDDLKPPDPSLGGPFITGIVSEVERRPPVATGDGEDDGEGGDETWNDLPQLGPLVPGGGSAVMDGGTWTTAPSTGKGRRQGKSTESLLYLAHYADATSAAAAANDHHGNQALKTKEGRRSWTSKNKPYACKVRGCNKSYFFIHDLRRHERQKHADVVTTLSSTSNPQEHGATENAESDQES